MVIHAVDHRGVDFHFLGHDATLVSRKRFPFFTDSEERFFIETSRKHSKLLSSFKTIFANGVETVVVNTFVLFQKLIGRLQRPVRSRISQPTEKRFSICAVGLDVIHHLGSEVLGRIVVLRQLFDFLAVLPVRSRHVGVANGGDNVIVRAGTD